MTMYGRVAWGISLLTLLTLGASFATISIVLDRYQERQFDEALLAVAHAEADEAPANRFSFTSRPGPAANDVGPLEKYGIIFDERGQSISATQPFDTSSPELGELGVALNVPFDFTFHSSRLRGVLVPIPGYSDRRLLLASLRDDLDGDSRFVRKAMGISLAVALGWMLTAIGWAVRRATREQARVADTLHRLAAGDTGARVLQSVSDRDLRRVGGDIDEIAERLARSIEYQRRFITHAAHELRSPLAALYGELQQALRRERSADEYKQSLASALKASRRLKRLADDLLELARAERNEKPESVPVAVAVSEAIQALSSLANEKSLAIEHDQTECSVIAAPGIPERILHSLIENAIRFSPKGGTIRLQVETSDVVKIAVRDEGAGVAPEERERVFEPFYRSTNVTRASGEGTGLGLTIARELARAHGGDIRVGDGRGGCFEVLLPVARP
jgi:two-component system heavy metal sensor histidine kinase CusS